MTNGQKSCLHQHSLEIPSGAAANGSSRLRRLRARAGGFTLIEILVVVVIIGILGAVIVPNLLSRPDQARITAANTDLRQLANALNIYRLDNFHYPSTEQGLNALVERPAGFPEPKNWNPDGYIKVLPTDPWGTPYVYERRSTDFSLFSLGADGVEGGEGPNQDVHLEGT